MKTTTSNTESRASAKAKLVKDSLQAASRAGIDTTAFALLAVLIAESWPSGDGWTADIARKTLAQRLSVSIRTIDTARDRLKAAGLIEHTPGDPRRASSFTIRETWGSAADCTPGEKPTAPQGRSQLHSRGAAHCTPEVQPVAPSSVLQDPPAPAAQPKPAAIAADGLIGFITELPPPMIAHRAKIIAERPQWLPTGLPWIDAFEASKLAAAASLSGEDLAHVYSQAERQRTTLTSPAGWVVSKLREIIKQRASATPAHRHP